jgi:hypothetical protein
VNIATACSRIMEATASELAAKTRVQGLRYALDKHLRRIAAEQGAAPSFKVKGLGQVRLDGMDAAPKPFVADADTFASWVAEHHPTEATATVTLSPERLEEALELLRFAGIITDEVKLSARPGYVNALLPTLAVDVEDVQTGEGFAPVDRHVTAVDPKTGELVPGIGATTATPKLVVVLDRDRKQAVIDETEAELASELPDDTLDEDQPAEPATVPAPRQMSQGELQKSYRDQAFAAFNRGVA